LVEDVVAILRELVEDGDAAMARSHGDRALDIAQAMRTALVTHLERETPYGEVWDAFETNPADGEDELAGALEAAVEADAALAQTLDQFMEEYYQLIGPPEARLPESERREEGFSVSGEEDQLPIEPSELEIERETAYLYDEVEAGSESIGRQIDEDEEDDAERAPISSFGPDADAAIGIFKELYAAVDAYPGLGPELRRHLKNALEPIESESARGQEASVEKIGRQLKEIREAAPDLFKLFLPVLTDPGANLNRAVREAAGKLRQNQSEEI
jgi:hypothetical protein